MDSNEIIQNNIHLALRRVEGVDANLIGVTVKNGVVTLYGTLKSYSEKAKVENIVKGISGVSAVVDQISVTTHQSDSDVEMIANLANIIDQKCPYVHNLNITFEHGEVTLEGEVMHAFQKDEISAIVNAQKNFRGFKNNIEVRFENIKPSSVSLYRALAANSLIDESHIDIVVSEHEVTLNGNVKSLLEKELAGYTVQHAPGVSVVHNNLIVHELAAEK